VPAWSPEIANELIRLARSEAKAFDQMQLQELVYIAHGWSLAITGQPLTGDRPEALEHGPEYRRLAAALVRWGLEPVTAEITRAEAGLNCSEADESVLCSGELSEAERDILARIHADYGPLQLSQLATVTRAKNTPWADVFAGGVGKGREISHVLIRNQFAEISAKFET